MTLGCAVLVLAGDCGGPYESGAGQAVGAAHGLEDGYGGGKGGSAGEGQREQSPVYVIDLPYFGTMFARWEIDWCLRDTLPPHPDPLQEIAMIKVVAPNMAQKVLDFAIQLHGGKGVSDDTMLARAFAGMRTLRIADGPDEVHVRTVARFELKRAMDHYQGATSPAMTTTPPPLADAWYRSQGRGGSEATLRPSIAPPSKL